MSTKTYKGRHIKKSYQTEDDGWSREDTYHETTDRNGRKKYVYDDELDN